MKDSPKCNQIVSSETLNSTPAPTAYFINLMTFYTILVFLPCMYMMKVYYILSQMDCAHLCVQQTLCLSCLHCMDTFRRPHVVLKTTSSISSLFCPAMSLIKLTRLLTFFASSSLVLSARFGFISLGSLTVLRLLCVC